MIIQSISGILSCLFVNSVQWIDEHFFSCGKPTHILTLALAWDFTNKRRDLSARIAKCTRSLAKLVHTYFFTIYSILNIATCKISLGIILLICHILLFLDIEANETIFKSQ